MTDQKTEPWLRGTRTEIDALRRGVLHALELAAEDVARMGLRWKRTRLDCRRWDFSCATSQGLWTG
jgi:hypothetical protein